MLGGLDPILVFSLYKNQDQVTDSKIPLANELGFNRLALPPVPIYLSETLTGLFIDTEDQNMDIETTVDTLSSGDDPFINQKGIGNTIKVELQARKDSIGLMLLSAMSDLLLPKLTSKEYSITYFHGAITIFNGKLHSFAINQTSDTDLAKITIEIMRASAVSFKAPDVPNGNGSLLTGTNGSPTGGTLPSGSSFTVPQRPVMIHGAP